MRHAMKLAILLVLGVALAYAAESGKVPQVNSSGSVKSLTRDYATATIPVETDQGGNNPPQSLADTTLAESFTGVTFPPTGWTRYNFTPNTSPWQRDIYDYRTSPACAGVGFYGPAANNDWLITPRLAIQGNDSLEFWFKASGSGYNERFKVRVCTTASVSDTGHYIPIFDTTIRSGTYRRRALSLSQFAGKQVFIAWYYYPTDQDWLYIDDIAVLRYPVGPADDMGGVGFVTPPGIIPPAAPVTITGIVRNLGHATRNSGVPVGLTVSGPNAYVYQDLDQVTTRTLAAGQNETIAFVPNWTPPAVQGAYWLKVWTNLSGDANRANDTFTTYCYVYTGLFEQFTGADFPPRGWDTAIVSGDYPWARSTARYRSAPASAMFPCYDAEEGSVAWLRTPRLDLRGGTAFDSLVFWWLHPPYSPHTDTLETQISYNLGGAWSTLGYLTGSMSSWQRIAYSLEGGPQNDSVYIRFIGRSQFCNDLHVDDIIGPPVRRLDRDVGCTHIVAPTGLLDSGVAVTPACSVYNSGDTAASFTVRMKIGASYNETATITDQALHTSAYATFPSWIASPRGAISVSCSTELAGDVHPANDQMTGAVEVPFLVPPGWARMEDLPLGGKSKNVKDGGALTYGKEGTDANDTGYVYAFKGNNRYEFYRYNTITGAWVTRESIPARNRNMKKKAVKKGSSLVMAGDGMLYATKGNNTLDWWQFNPVTQTWTQKTDVPTGAKNCKEGVGSAAVQEGADSYVYLLRGSGTFDFYRYNTATDAWDITLPTAPSGLKGKPYKNGSSITYDGDDTIYCLKGSYNEFAAYCISGKTWVTKSLLPLVAPPGTKKKKVKDGSGMACFDKSVYALKGGNTDEFWMFNTTDQTWYVQTQLTTGSKRVKGGGALTFADANKSLYAFRGNNTREYWMYGPLSADRYPPSAYRELKSVQGSSSLITHRFSLSVTPNPTTTSLNPSISYSLTTPGNVNLRLYDITGKLLITLASGFKPAGSYSLQLTANSLQQKLAAGIYVLRLDSDSYRTTEKLIVE